MSTPKTIALVLLVVAAGVGAARADDSSCKARVTGDLSLDVSVTNPPKPSPPFTNGPIATVSTDYWLTDKEMRQALSAMTGAFDSVGAALKKKGTATTKADVEDAAKAGATGPSNADRERKVDEAMKKDPRLFLLMMSCGNESVRLVFTPASGSKYANIPFKPGHYKILPGAAAKPGDLAVMPRVKDGDALKLYTLAGPGELTLSRFDAHAAVGTFTFPAKSRATGGAEKKITVAGSFSYFCKGSASCKP
jgi:hypothetical protein